jgi:hypothetical protein
MSELGRGRVVVKESLGNFIPDLPDVGKKNQVGRVGKPSRDSVTGALHKHIRKMSERNISNFSK